MKHLSIAMLALSAVVSVARAQPAFESESVSASESESDDLAVPLVALDPFGTEEPIFSRGWSVPATWVGVISAGLVLALGLTAVAVASPADDYGLAFGAATLGTLGVAGPLVALGGASARAHPFIPGSAPLQIAAWICWGLSLAGGTALLAADLGAHEPARFAFLAPAIVGAASVVLFSFDALVSAIQVDLVNGRPPRAD